MEPEFEEDQLGIITIGMSLDKDPLSVSYNYIPVAIFEFTILKNSSQPSLELLPVVILRIFFFCFEFTPNCYYYPNEKDHI